MINHVRHWLTILLLCIPLSAQKAPFTFETANQATGYMEWILDVRFTPEQRQQYQQMLNEIWRGKEGSKDTISAMASAYETISGLDESKQTQMRAGKQPEFLRLLETASDDKSRWLLNIYRAAHSGSPQPAPNSGTLTGRWTDGHISAIQYRNATTGASAPTNGRTFTYEFKLDGTYSFTGLMQSVMYSCTSTMFSNESGTYTIDGDSISLRPERNPYRMTNNCAPSSNRESPGKLISRTYRFRIDSDGGHQYLELRGPDGSVQKFSLSH